MKPLGTQLVENDRWPYFEKKVTYKDTLMPKNTVKGSQFAQPLFQYSGACAGCGETPYIKLITQLMGDRMMVANATGCSSIYSSSAPSTPFCVNAEGRGPSWASSLFEDNAEYGYGMRIGVEQMRDHIADLSGGMIAAGASPELKAALQKWLDGRNDPEASKAAAAALVPLLEKDGSPQAKEILRLKDYLAKRSVWVIGGDGWAYDIGYGGLDHVLASGDESTYSCSIPRYTQHRRPVVQVDTYCGGRKFATRVKGQKEGQRNDGDVVRICLLRRSPWGPTRPRP